MITLESNTKLDASESPAFGSFAVTLADDDYMTMRLPIDYGHVLVSETSIDSHGMAWLKSNSAVKYFGGANFAVMVNTILTGTKGVDGQLTVSTNTSNFYIENRTGVSVNLSITFLGIATNRI